MADRKFYRHNGNKAKSTSQKQIVQNPEAMKISIADLLLSESTTSLLDKNNIKNAAELCIRTEKDMYKIQTLNKRVLVEISNALKKHNLAFRPFEAPIKQGEAVAEQKAAIKTPLGRKNEAKLSNDSNQANNNTKNSRTEKINTKNNKSVNMKTDTNETIDSIYPSGKIDFLSSRQSDKNKIDLNKDQQKRVKEPVITKPLPVEEWRKIQRAGKWGFFDGMKTVINPEYDEVFHFKEGLACVELNEKCGYIDSQNNIVIPIEYETAFSFSDELAVVVTNGKCGYINKENELVFPCVYDAAAPFEEGVARVKQAGRWGFLSKDGAIRWK